MLECRKQNFQTFQHAPVPLEFERSFFYCQILGFCCNQVVHSQFCLGIDPSVTTMNEVYKKFGLDTNTVDFTGHALALYRDDEYV